MKNTTVYLLMGYILFSLMLCFGIYYIRIGNFDNSNIKPSREINVQSVEDKDTAIVENTENLHLKAGGDIRDDKSHISYSPVKAYEMKAEEGTVNIYEIYENGYREKIKNLDINPKHMRKTDYDMLAEGITVETYTEICSLIEDFSS